ncbi:hypothetical protein V5O48_010247 [Marasmius crinis-equi]|uniref:GST N-terminal domain-containing protein n=1 Tax=Marasmius crinis-equi TaxID=585013 RepID=A0ABR3F8V6_9AGAR
MSVIFYRYDGSPYSTKLDNALTLKRIPHQRVNVHPIVSERPEITDLLGVGYRRIPILAIGNDIYCDTNLIIPVLERRFPPSQGYGTLFPPDKHESGESPRSNTGLLKAFAKHYGDAVLNRLAVSLLSWEKLPPQMLEDRSKIFGHPIDPQKFAEARPKTLSQLASHLALIEEQLQDGRAWLLDTTTPSLADLSVHLGLFWMTTGALFDSQIVHSVLNDTKFPRIMKWLESMNTHLETLRHDQTETRSTIDGDDAAQKIAKASHEPDDIVGFDETAAEWLGVQRGGMARIRPDDSAKDWPHEGKLVSLNYEEVCVESRGTAGTFRVHFPRIGFSIEAL